MLNKEDSDEDNVACIEDTIPSKIHTKLLAGSGCCGNTERIF
jgi:hypothetical protein